MSPSPEKPPFSVPVDLEPANRPKPEFSPEERKILLHLGHEAIVAKLQRREISLLPPSSHLAQPRGVFTTLHLEGSLRGCVGYVAPVTPLYQAVAETAQAAAFDDTRFLPVSGDEAVRLEMSLNILGPLFVIRPEELEVGRHGLVIGMGGHRGLLLPEVAHEHGWDRVTFIEQTCRKAGLPPDAWLRGATLEAFITESFGDRDFV
jgi:AmmeMemoRadiSam system protein A